MSIARTIFLTASLVFTSACGDDGGSAPEDAPVSDAGVDAAPDASCFTNPQTHEEIINACTTAQKIDKDSHPPLLNADGSLPPLPP
ncbi:MAG TPA: hypothetical protein VM513_15280 [Kofleriaceae bacterium]|jgi:hypothetical protein|nr:hypothetical protein [Kofleriaceae bacterium]